MHYFISPYGDGAASTRARVSQWLERFSAPRVVVDYCGLAFNRRSEMPRRTLQILAAETRLRRIRPQPDDVVFIHREASPILYGGVERRLARQPALTIFDFDDAIFLQRDLLTNRERKSRLAAQNADLVIAGNDYLAEWAKRYCADVHVVPTCVEPVDYQHPSPAFNSSIGPSHGLWLGGPATEHYLLPLTDALIRVNAATGMRLAVASAGTQQLGPLEGMIDRVEWFEGFNSELSRFRFGLGPLDDSPWSRGKCAYKLLQYGAAGLPFVASPVGANADVARALGMPTARTEEDWRRHMLDLWYLGSEGKNSEGARMRSVVERQFSYSAWADRWSSLVGLT